jgi:NFACT protein RNA binding domain
MHPGSVGRFRQLLSVRLTLLLVADTSSIASWLFLVARVIMVFYFQSRNGEYTYYMGKDKYENEDLIKYGLPEDVWFHVDDLSSAHVYLRMKPGMALDDIPEDILLECAALVKANSIQGCKVCIISIGIVVCT